MCVLFLIIGIIPLWANLQAKLLGTVIRSEKTKHSLIFWRGRKSTTFRTLSISPYIITPIPRKRLILILRKSILNSKKIKRGILRINIIPTMRPKEMRESPLHPRRLILKSQKRITVSWNSRNIDHRSLLFLRGKAFWRWFLQ